MAHDTRPEPAAAGPAAGGSELFDPPLGTRDGPDPGDARTSLAGLTLQNEGGRPRYTRRRLTYQEVIEVYRHTDGRCGICDREVPTGALVIDHVVPIARGGNDETSNMQIAHNVCNQRKHQLLLGERPIRPIKATPAPPVLVATEDDDQCITISEAAALLCISEQSVRQRIRRDHLAARRVGARLWLIPRAEVERASRAGRLKPGPKAKRGEAAGAISPSQT